MTQSRDWHELEVARSAVADPATSPMELLTIGFAQPSLRVQIAMHPAADADLLTWIAHQEEPQAAATARARLAGQAAATNAPAPAAPEWAPQAPQSASGFPAAPGLAPKGRARPIGMLVAGGIGAVVLVVVAVTVVVPLLQGSNSAIKYAPDFRDQPGIVAVDAQLDLPSSDGQWSTKLNFVEDAGMAIAFNTNPAIAAYREDLAEYAQATAEYQSWESDYQTGYRDGQTCLTRTSEQSYYWSMEAYCNYNRRAHLTTSAPAGEAGFLDAIASRPATPDQPGGYYTPPTVPPKPTPPAAGNNLRGIDLATGKVAWTLEASSLWEAEAHELLDFSENGNELLVVLGDGETGSDAGAENRYLAVLDAKTGAEKAGKLLDSETVRQARLYDDVVVLLRSDGRISGLSASDLSDTRWSVTANAPVWGEAESRLGDWDLPGYLLTDAGYLSVADGSWAPFARDAGSGVVYLVLDGTTDEYLRVERISDEFLDVAGFDRNRDEQTWRLRDQSALSTRAGNLLIAKSGEEITAYRINRDDLEREWRYSCSGDCWVSSVDAQRVTVVEWEADKTSVLSAVDGEEIGSIRDESYGSLQAGRSVLYVLAENRLTAYDSNKSGLPTLWRVNDITGNLRLVGDRLVLVDDGDGRGRLGILGLDGDDWGQFKQR